MAQHKGNGYIVVAFLVMVVLLISSWRTAVETADGEGVFPPDG